MKAAVFSGGGVKGAFQVGALRSYLARTNTPFDAFFGVSTGNLNAAVMAQGATLLGQRLLADRLADIYLAITGNRNVYTSPGWLPFKLIAWLFGPSIFRPTGLQRLISEHVKPSQIRTTLGIGVTCLETGEYATVSGQNAHLLDFILASASMPVYFPAVRVMGRHYVDGGVRHQTPLADACHWLKTQPGPHELVVFLTSPLTLTSYTGSVRGPAAAARVFDLMETTMYLNDLAQLHARNMTPSPGDVAIAVTTAIPTHSYGDALAFDPASIRRMLADGAASSP